MHPLVRKELREHAWVLTACWLLCAVGLLAAHVSMRDAGSPLTAFRLLVMVYGVLLSLVLVNRLVVREYGGRTQLFLETLPIGRGRVLAIKWVTGAVCLLVPMVLGFLVTLLVAADEVVLTARFVLLVALRGFTFLLFFYALAFLVGLMGRYRYVIWAALLLLAFVADTVGQLPINRWPPLQLVSESMPFQREGVPLTWFWVTWVLTAVFIAAAYLLATGMRGALVVALSRRMSLREKAAVAAAFLSAIYIAFQVEQRKAKPPFELLEAIDGGNGALSISVARVDEVDEGEAMTMARHLAEDVLIAHDYLALRELPSVAALPDVSLDPDLFMLAGLPDSDGVVVRGALGTGRFDAHGFRAFTLARVLDWHSRGGTRAEAQRWLRDGYAHWQIARDDAPRRELLSLRAAVAGEMLAAGDASLADMLRHWLTARELLGECLGDALAWKATDSLARSLGEERFRALARTLLGARIPDDVRGYLFRSSPHAALREAGASIDAVAQDVAAVLREERARLPARLAGIPTWPVSIQAVPMRGSVFELRYELQPGTDGEAPAFTVRYATLGPWDGEITRDQMARVDAVQAGVLPTSFPRGTRVLTAIELPVPELDCVIRLDSRRWVVE